MGGIKRDCRDRAFSKYIRTRDGWRCQRCGTYYPEGQRQGLDSAHFYGRRNKGVRWDEDNAIALCRGCHQYFGEHPNLMQEFMLTRLGQQRYDALAFRAKRVTKFTEYDLCWIYDDLKRKLKIQDKSFNSDNANESFVHESRLDSSRRRSRKKSKWKKKVDGTVVERDQ